MNDNNQKFIEEFKQRTDGYQLLNKRVHDLHNKRVAIKYSLTELHNFLNKTVMASSTSSLIRTDVELPYAADNYNFGKNIRKITINHKGMGSIRMPDPAKGAQTGYGSSGATFSDEMDEKDMLEIMTNIPLRDAIRSDLLKKNSYKALKYFNDVCTAEPELKELSVMNQKYLDSIECDFETPQQILQTEVKQERYEKRDEGEYKVVIEPFNATSIRISKDDKIKLVNKDVDESNDGHCVELPFDEIETSMIMMQMPDEMDKVLSIVEDTIGKDHAHTQHLLNSVKEKLCVYAVMNELKE
jgi:hypothetical protein